MEWPIPTPEPTGEFVTRKCKVCVGKKQVGTGRGKKRIVSPCTACSATGEETVPKMTRKQGIGAKISRLLTDYVKNPSGMDPWKRWENWEEGVEVLMDTLGPLPLPSIHLVPEDKIMGYACLDSVSTIRVNTELDKRLVELRRRFSGSRFR